MRFKIAIVINSKQFQYMEFPFDQSVAKSSIHSLSDLKQSAIHALFYSQDLSEDGLGLIQDESKFYPCCVVEELGLTIEDVMNLPHKEAFALLKKALERWTLIKNMITIEEIFSLATYYSDLWNNDRQQFFEELWFTLKTNLGTLDLKIFFHDLDKEDSDRPKLVFAKIEGTRGPEMIPASPAELDLIKAYSDHFGPLYEVTDYDPEKGHLCVVASVDDSPILIMANVTKLNKLHTSLMTAFFEGIQPRY